MIRRGDASVRSVIGFLRDSPIFGTYVRFQVAFALGVLLAAGGAALFGVGGLLGTVAVFALFLLVLAGLWVALLFR
jgi:hypothetical protein